MSDGYSLRECDEYVKEHCGRFSLLKQAQSGYTSMGEFESAFYGLYESPEMQRKFGVEELALDCKLITDDYSYHSYKMVEGDASTGIQQLLESASSRFPKKTDT